MRQRLTYANVMSTLCFFLLLGGGAYAAGHLGKNTVGTKQLKKNAVVTAKVKNEAITAAKVKKGALTGSQINASTLGTVPTADKAGAASRASVADSVAPAEAWHQVGTPGEPQFQNGCDDTAGAPVTFYKDQVGVVHFEGVFESCKKIGNTAFQLPAGYRPGKNFLEFPLALASGEQAVVVQGPIETAFNEPFSVFCTTSFCYLDGITFRAES